MKQIIALMLMCLSLAACGLFDDPDVMTIRGVTVETYGKRWTIRADGKNYCVKAAAIPKPKRGARVTFKARISRTQDCKAAIRLEVVSDDKRSDVKTDKDDIR